MAKLYMIAVATDAPLHPTFAKLPIGGLNGAVHVEDLATARRMEPDELGAILDELAVILGSQEEPVHTPELPRAPELPMESPPRAGLDPNDPDAWRAEVEDNVSW